MAGPVVSGDAGIAAKPADESDPSFLVAMVPIVLVISLNYIFSRYVIPSLDTSFLAQPRYGETTVSSVAGIWSIVLAVAIACVAVVVLNFRRFANLANTVNTGTFGSMLPMLNVASEVAYGSVVASLAAFATIKNALTSVSSDPATSIFITVNVLAGITGSASGGLSIALASLGDFFVQQANAAGVSMEIMHRISAMASGGMDMLPHNGAVITVLSICALTHRESYFDILMMSIIATAAGAVGIVLYHTVGLF